MLRSNFSRTTSAAMPRDNRGMAATVVEGTAPKLVQVNAGKLFRIASNISDSRKDGTFFHLYEPRTQNTPPRTQGQNQNP